MLVQHCHVGNLAAAQQPYLHDGRICDGELHSCRELGAVVVGASRDAAILLDHTSGHNLQCTSIVHTERMLAGQQDQRSGTQKQPLSLCSRRAAQQVHRWQAASSWRDAAHQLCSPLAQGAVLSQQP